MAEQNTHQRAPRLPAWVALMIFSIVVLAAMSSRGIATAAEKWVIAVASISMTFSLFATVAYFVPNARVKFVGELPEGGLALFLLVFWIAGLPVIMNPRNAIAVTTTVLGVNFVVNANVYFFSWAAFICIIYIFGSYAREHLVGVEESLSSITPKLAKWYMLITTSIVVLASASEFQKSQDCGNIDSETCTSNKYAISLGVIAFCFALVVAFLAHFGNLSVYVETGIAFLLFVLYTAGVGVITFDQGSGTTIGNLYFSTWSGFILAIFLLVECYHGVMEERSGEGSPSRMAENPKVTVADSKDGPGTENDIEVEAIPDDQADF